jgi:hypothetical protein
MKRTYSTLILVVLATSFGLALAAPRDGLAQQLPPQDGSVVSVTYDQGMGCRAWEYGDPALFYNFYVPNNCGGAPADLYIAPRPVPPLVGHTYYTYQPFMPHEFLYPHHRTYRRYYDGARGMTRARAHWYRGPLTTAFNGIYNTIRIPR